LALLEDSESEEDKSHFLTYLLAISAFAYPVFITYFLRSKTALEFRGLEREKYDKSLFKDFKLHRRTFSSSKYFYVSQLVKKNAFVLIPTFFVNKLGIQLILLVFMQVT